MAQNSMEPVSLNVVIYRDGNSQIPIEHNVN
jgi:hypothetical protein